jgi:hypothetical protein
MGYHKNLAGTDLHEPARQQVENNTAADIAELYGVKISAFGTSYPQINVANGLCEAVHGITSELISACGGEGRMCTYGLLKDVDTSPWAAGTKLFVDDSGALNTSPTTTTVKALVLGQHSATGSVWVYPFTDFVQSSPTIQNLSSIQDVSTGTFSAGDLLLYDGANWSATAASSVAAKTDLSSIQDVSISTISANDVLTWITTASQWENKAPGAGGGSIILWNDACANTPVEESYNGFKIRNFGAGLSQTLYGQLVVPNTLDAGGQINIICSILASETGQVRLGADTHLIRMGIDSITSTAYHYSATNTSFNITGVNIPYRVEIPLTDSSGQISGITLSATDGNILNIGLQATLDSASAGIKFLQDTIEVSI